MNPYLLALKSRLEKEEITQELYDSMVEELTPVAEVPIEITIEPTIEERLQMAEETIMFMLMGGM